MSDLLDGCGMSKPKETMDDDLAEEETEIPGTQETGGDPATQPCDNMSFAEESIEGSQEDLDPAWGVLYPLCDNWRAARLTEDICTFGRSASNHFSIGEDQAGSRIGSISKVHFVIKRTSSGVVIVDKSSNGTFVNKKNVGKGKSRILEHNASIALSDPNAVSYVYMSTNRDFQRDYPRQLRDKYLISKELGTGACGVVKLGFKISGSFGVSLDNPQRVAVKKVDKRKAPLHKGAGSDVLNEVRILRAVDHPCVIRMEDVVDTEHFLYIVLELAEGGELFDKIVQKTRLNESEAKLVFYQLASAIDYLHSVNVAHRDLKPENILLCSSDDSKPLVKITDMGLSKLVDIESKLKTFCGTPQYLAPEVLMSRIRGDGSYGFEVDYWSLGVILYVMISGCPPFSPERTDKPLIRQVCDGDYSFPAQRWNSVSKEAVDLIKGLMTVGRRKRLTARQALDHPWIKNDPHIKQKAEELMAWSSSKRPQRQQVTLDDDDIDAQQQQQMSFGPPQPIIDSPPPSSSSANQAATAQDDQLMSSPFTDGSQLTTATENSSGAINEQLRSPVAKKVRLAAGGAAASTNNSSSGGGGNCEDGKEPA